MSDIASHLDREPTWGADDDKYLHFLPVFSGEVDSDETVWLRGLEIPITGEVMQELLGDLGTDLGKAGLGWLIEEV